MTALSERHRISRQLRALDPDRPAGRKTARKNPRREHQLPDYTVTIVLTRGRSLKPGETFDLVGVTATAWNTIRITAKNKEFAIGQASKVLGRMDIARHQAVLTKADEPGPTDSGPIRKGYSRVVWIEAHRWLEKDEAGVIGMHMLPLF